MTTEFAARGNHKLIVKTIHTLSADFCSSQNTSMRKGGLIGLASMAIGLGPNQIEQHLNGLVRPVLSCMGEQQDKYLRFYATEALLNVAKVARDNILPFFNDIFVVMSKIVTDLDTKVRVCAELVNTLLKDIITESPDFKTESFIPTLKQCMSTKDPFGRTFCIGWIQAMHVVRNPTLNNHLPEILDPLFAFLTDPKPEIVNQAKRELVGFLSKLKARTPEPEVFTLMTNSLVGHVQSKHSHVQLMSIIWIRAFVEISGLALYPYISRILAAILPNLNHSEELWKSLGRQEYNSEFILFMNLFICLGII